MRKHVNTLYQQQQICFIEGDGRPIYIHNCNNDLLYGVLVLFVCLFALFLPRKYKVLADRTVSNRY